MLLKKQKRKFSEEHKKSLRLAWKPKGNVFGKGSIPWNKGKKHSEETKDKMRKAKLGKVGEEANGWKGGLSRDKHSGGCPKYKKWRLDVFKRDDYTCQGGGCDEPRGCYLEAHHIKSWVNYPELRYEITNGMALCKECHKLTDNFCGKGRKTLKTNLK